MDKIIQFPFYKQENKNDDGRACLRMVSRFYGIENNFTELGQTVDNKKSDNLLDITKAAEQAGFKALVAPLTYEKLKNEVPLPAICHFTYGHFVVVHEIIDTKVYVADPALDFGLKIFEKKDFMASWGVDVKEQIKNIPGLSKAVRNKHIPQMGIALLLEPTPNFFGT